MAEANKNDAEGDAPPPKKRGKLLIIIAAAVLVVVIAAVAAVILLKKPAAEEEGDGDGPPAKSAKAKNKATNSPPVFSKLDPFVVKLQADQQEAYVQAVPELKLDNAMTADQVKQFMPEIRHKLLLILAGKKAAELSTPEGMQVLANQIRESINATLNGGPSDPSLVKLDSNEDGPVIAVFFTSLIVQ